MIDILAKTEDLKPGESVLLEGDELLDYADTLFPDLMIKTLGLREDELEAYQARIRGLTAIRLTKSDYSKRGTLLSEVGGDGLLAGLRWDEVE